MPTAKMGRDVDRACAHLGERLPVFVWDAGVLEGNPISLPKIKSLLAGGTVPRRRLSDQEQILNLAESAKRLVALVKFSEFQLSKTVFTAVVY